MDIGGIRKIDGGGFVQSSEQIAESQSVSESGISVAADQMETHRVSTFESVMGTQSAVERFQNDSRVKDFAHAILENVAEDDKADINATAEELKVAAAATASIPNVGPLIGAALQVVGAIIAISGQLSAQPTEERAAPLNSNDFLKLSDLAPVRSMNGDLKAIYENDMSAALQQYFTRNTSWEAKMQANKILTEFNAALNKFPPDFDKAKALIEEVKNLL